jgi:hypothetical protein
VPHQDFDSDIEIVASAFERTGQAMEQVVGVYLDGGLSAPEAEDAIEMLGDALKREVSEAVADLIPRAYADGLSEALQSADSPGPLPLEDHETMQALSQRRLQRRLSHAADGLVVDALDQLDAAVEARLAPLKTEEALP